MPFFPTPNNDGVTIASVMPVFPAPPAARGALRASVELKTYSAICSVLVMSLPEPVAEIHVAQPNNVALTSVTIWRLRWSKRQKE